MIREIKNVRDMIAVVMAPELAKFIGDLAKAQPVDPSQPITEAQGIERMQEVVGFILDHITAYSFEQLAHHAALRERGLNGKPR